MNTYKVWTHARGDETIEAADFTNPFTTVTDRQDTGDRVYLPWKRCKGKLLIVRPMIYQKEGFVTTNAPEGTDVVFADVALLDPIPAAVTEDGDELVAVAAPSQFRGQGVFAAYLKGTFKRYLAQTLIGTIYKGVPTKGQPPLMWQDLSGDADCVTRGQQFLIAHPEFLIPVDAGFTSAVPEVAPDTARYTAPPRAKADSVYTQHEPGRGPAQNTLDQMRAMAKANGGNNQEPPF